MLKIYDKAHMHNNMCINHVLVHLFTALTLCYIRASIMYHALSGKIVPYTLHIQSWAVWRASQGEKPRQRAMIYGLRRTNWWLVVTESRVFIDLCFVLWITIPDLVCMQRWESAFRSKSQIWIKAYSRSPHEYLICVAAITHFTSPFCPLVVVVGVCVCVCVC